MASIFDLPFPHVDARPLGARCLRVLSDEALFRACGILVAFTGRAGGVSSGCYSSLNLGLTTLDDEANVHTNRHLLQEALDDEVSFIAPLQVHSCDVVTIRSVDEQHLSRARMYASRGADAMVVGTPSVAALMCFADCLSVVIVSPSGRFALVHAGWRGMIEGVIPQAIFALQKEDDDTSRFPAASYNVYFGPHIGSCCFEVGDEVLALFSKRFSQGVIKGKNHIDLSAAALEQLSAFGCVPQRCFDTQICTLCSQDSYFSYRGSGGVCGRHGALVYRQAR